MGCLNCGLTLSCCTLLLYRQSVRWFYFERQTRSSVSASASFQVKISFLAAELDVTFNANPPRFTCSPVPEQTGQVQCEMLVELVHIGFVALLLKSFY